MSISRRPRRTHWLGALAFFVLALPVPVARAGPPPPGECPSVSGVPLLEEGKGLVDAPPVLLREGTMVDAERLLMLRRLLPAVIWQHREAFFYDGMRMEIGGCYAAYPAFGPYKAATQRFRGQAKLDDEGNLLDYTAGLPFPARRHRPGGRARPPLAGRGTSRSAGAAPATAGRFRITEIPARVGGILTFDGRFFFLQIGHRSRSGGRRLPAARAEGPGVGGRRRVREPLRRARTGVAAVPLPRIRARSTTSPDDIFVYVPTMRKQRRAATNWVDGLYVPTYTSGNEGAGGGLVYGDGASIAPTAGLSIAASEDMGRGLTGSACDPTSTCGGTWASRR